MINQPDSSPLSALPALLGSIPKAVRDRVLQEYNLATIKIYDDEFFGWRKKMLKIKEAGLMDRDFGER